MSDITEPMSKKETQACLKLINVLKPFLASEGMTWEPFFESLVQSIEQGNEGETPVLSHSPIIQSDLLHQLISPLDDSKLLLLIEGILNKNLLNTVYKNSINQILLIFCRRLYSDQNPKSPIHAWWGQSYTDRLVQGLLACPECVYELSITNTAIYSWVTWTDNASALKTRIDAVFNWHSLNPDTIEQIALNWLEHFHSHQEQLHQILNNLKQSEINRTIVGKKIGQKLKKQSGSS